MNRSLPSPRRALHALGAAAVVGAVSLAVVLAVPGAVGASASHVVLSGSMEPAIGAGDVVVVRDVPAGEIDAGDVITYTDGQRVTHRVVEVRGSGENTRFVTKGDANEDRDAEPVTPAEVEGAVWFHVPHAGRLVLFAQSPYGLVAFVVVPGLLLVASELRSLYRDALTEVPADGAGDEGTDPDRTEGGE
jgi:signal peptidase